MEKLSSLEIRNKWIEYFKSKKHYYLESSSLIPDGDDSLLFINAGVTPLKKYFDGTKTPKNRRIVSIQKCIRTNDIEEVGVSKRHLTFFEMMGNFSIGDYFKEEAINMAYDFLINFMEFPKEKIYITYYPDDELTKKLWLKEGIEESHLIPISSNFWEIGEGPSGPDTEIFYDRGPSFGGDEAFTLFKEDKDQDRYVEIWNNVFSEFNAEKGVARKDYKKLPQQNIDTGAGLERFAMIIQDVPSIYDTDLFLPIIKKLEELSKVKYEGQKEFKIIVDHLRSVVMALGDNETFGNSGRHYVLRRLIRRSFRMGRNLGLDKAFLYVLASKVIDVMGPFYKNLYDNKDSIIEKILREENLFLNTLVDGEKLLLSIIEDAKKLNKEVSSYDIFKLHDTYGFPIDLSEEYLEEAGLKFNKEELNKYVLEQKELSSKNKNIISDMHKQNEALMNFKKESEFLYDTYEVKGKVIGIFNAEEEISSTEDKSYIIFDKTPFYAEMGGAIADTGEVSNSNFKGNVIKVTMSPNGQTLHLVKTIEGKLNEGDEVNLVIDKEKREKIESNHSATHLLHFVLRKLYGDTVVQKGSYICDKYFRFDFAINKTLSDYDIIKVEEEVNKLIKENISCKTSILSKEEALNMGALHLFNEKYEDEVRVVSFGDSKEFCGGCHVKNTSLIKKFMIYNALSKGSDVYRIEAVTMDLEDKFLECILPYLKEIKKNLAKIEEIKVKAEESGIKLDNSFLFEEKKEESYKNILFYKDQSLYFKELASRVENKYYKLKEESILKDLDELVKDTKEVNSFKYLIKGFKDIETPILKALADSLVNHLGESMVFLINMNNDSLTYVCKATNKLSANYLVKKLSEMTKGRGGGNDTFATGGTTSLNDFNKEDINALEKEVIELINE